MKSNLKFASMILICAFLPFSQATTFGSGDDPSTSKTCTYRHNGIVYHLGFVLIGECPDIYPPHSEGGEIISTEISYKTDTNNITTKTKTIEIANVDDHNCILTLDSTPLPPSEGQL